MSMNKTQIKGIFDAMMASEKVYKSLDRNSVADFSFNSESLSSQDRRVAEDSFRSLKETIETTLDGINLESLGGNRGVELTPVQKAAAVQAAVMTINPSAYTKALNGSFGSVKPEDAGLNFESVDTALDFNSTLKDLSVNLEAFDGQQLQSVYYTTIALAVATSKQDEFAEAFFPLIVMNPADAFYEVKINIDNFVKEYRHKRY